MKYKLGLMYFAAIFLINSLSISAAPHDSTMNASKRRREEQEALRKKIRDEENERWSLKQDGERFVRHKQNKFKNAKKVQEADDRHDLIERRAVRENILGASLDDEKLVKLFMERVKQWNSRYYYDKSSRKIDEKHEWSINNCKDELEKIREFRKLLKNDLIAINDDITKKFIELEEDMATNDAQINAADETHDLIERIRVRKDIISKCKNAASFIERYYDEFHSYLDFFGNTPEEEKYLETIKRYRDYQRYVEKSLPAIESDLSNRMNPN